MVDQCCNDEERNPLRMNLAQESLSNDDKELGAFDFDIEVDACDVDSNEQLATVTIFPREQREGDTTSPLDPTDVDGEDDIMDYFMDGGCYGCESVTPSVVVQSILKAPRRWIVGDAEEKLDENDNKSVGFKDVTIREFAMTLGDHPSAVSGPPVRIDWDKEKEETKLDFEEYEQGRQHTRRSRQQLKLSLSQRHDILVKEQGFVFEEIKGAWSKSLGIRAQRRETMSQTWAQRKWDEVNESIWRKFDRWINALNSSLFCICY
jgi:hypothetical protein